MEENKEKVKVKKNTRKKYNGSKENKQKAATKAKSRTRNTKTKSSKAKTTRPKSELLKEPIEESVKEPIEEPIKDDVKVAVGTAESKESARIEELESQIEKLLAEKKDAGSISRTKFEEIYNLQSELRNLVLLKRQRQANEKNNAEPIKDEESKDKSKEPNRIDELKSRIEKLQAEKQSYYEVSGEGESAIVNAERKDASSINRTKIDIEIYKLQSELRDLLTKENEKSEEEPEKGEENKDGKSKEEPENGEENREDPKKDDKKTEEIDSPEVKAVKSQISILDNKINSEEWVLRNNEGNYTPEELAQIKAGIDKLKAQRDELNGKLNDLQTGKDIESKESGEKDDEGQEPSKKNDETKDAESEKDSPEVKVLKDRINELEGKIKAERNALINNGGKYLESDIKEIKERLNELKGEHAELLGRLSDLEKGLKDKDSKSKDDDATKAGEPTKDPSKDDSEGKGKDGEKDGKDSKETTEPEMATYRIGPFKRFLMNVIRKIKSWAKADGRISKICDSLEGAVIGSATPLIDGATEEKEAKKALNLGKVKDFEKEVADAKNAEYSKEKYEQADNHVEAKAKLDLADMEYIKDVIMKAWDSKETNLMTEVFNKQYKEGFRGEDGINEDELKKFIKDNNIPSVTKTDRINAALWRTSQSIVEMAKEKGFVVNQGKGKNANAKPLSEIYPSLEARIKTDRVSEEYSKKEEKTSETSKDGKVKASNDKSENDSKVVKEEDDLDK